MRLVRVMELLVKNSRVRWYIYTWYTVGYISYIYIYILCGYPGIYPSTTVYITPLWADFRWSVSPQLERCRCRKRRRWNHLAKSYPKTCHSVLTPSWLPRAPTAPGVCDIHRRIRCLSTNKTTSYKGRYPGNSEYTPYGYYSKRILERHFFVTLFGKHVFEG